jgi:hypothetical protein
MHDDLVPLTAIQTLVPVLEEALRDLREGIRASLGKRFRGNVLPV